MIEILLPTFNGSKYLEVQLQSLFDQTNQDWTLLIRDDGSTDETVSIIEKWQLTYPEKIDFIKDEFKKLGASLLAITPETPDNSISTQEKNNLEFEVLSDVDNVVGFQYKVVFKLTDDVKEIYENGFGLSNFNGNDKGELPLAATYIIASKRQP